MEGIIQNRSFKWLNAKSKDTNYDDQLVDSVIGMLSNDNLETQKLSSSDELELLAKILDSVSEAVNDGTITESEANTLLKYLISNVISKKVTNLFDNIFSRKNESNLLFATGKKFETEDW